MQRGSRQAIAATAVVPKGSRGNDKRSNNVFEGFRYGKVKKSPGIPDRSRKCKLIGKALIGNNGALEPVRAPAKQKKRSSSDAASSSKPPAIEAESESQDQAEPSSGADQASQEGLPEKLGNKPLKLAIVGHNPSSHAWKTGHYYSNPSNRMWTILMSSGIAPQSIRGPEDDDRMMLEHRVGFTDVGTGKPGTDSSAFRSPVFKHWREDFYGRLASHVERACASVGCTCGKCGAPRIVAFAGKRQYTELLNVGKKGKAKTSTVRSSGACEGAKQEPLIISALAAFLSHRPIFCLHAAAAAAADRG